MASEDVTTPTIEMEGKKMIGQVKWFNNKAGYGFITTNGDTSEDQQDIFVHYSTVIADKAPYKYLVLGEYVEFQLTKSTNEQHQYQAVNVTGIHGGRLMCETRQMNRPVPEDGSTTPRGPPPPRTRRPEIRPRRGNNNGVNRQEKGQEQDGVDQEGFKPVGKKRKPKQTDDSNKE